MQALQDIDTILLAAFPQITPADYCAWINSIGIYFINYSHVRTHVFCSFGKMQL